MATVVVSRMRGDTSILLLMNGDSALVILQHIMLIFVDDDDDDDDDVYDDDDNKVFPMPLCFACMLQMTVGASVKHTPNLAYTLVILAR